jgi:hypothetical protein
MPASLFISDPPQLPAKDSHALRSQHLNDVGNLSASPAELAVSRLEGAAQKFF